MKRLVSRIALAGLLTGVFAFPAYAQHGPLGGHGLRGHAFRCLKDLDLSDAQKTAIRTILQNSRATLKADHDAVKADFQKLNADADAGAAPAVIGQDYLAVRADRQKIKDEIASIRTQIAGQLTADQKAKFQACVDALKESEPSGSFRGGRSF
jgi:Spy/CpxP family protein refolding chaperone